MVTNYFDTIKEYAKAHNDAHNDAMTLTMTHFHENYELIQKIGQL